MMLTDLKDKTVLITGGTRGIGLATGLAFGKLGACAVLTHRWGTADEDDLRRQFSETGAPDPFIVEADVSNDDDLNDLMDSLKGKTDGVHAFVSNAAVAPSVSEMSDYRKRDFFRAIEYSTWPMAAYTNAIHDTFGRYPRYVVGMSSPGHLRFLEGYDAVAMAKSMLETMSFYLAKRLRPEGVNVNIVRAGFVDTEALESVMGTAAVEALRRDHPEQLIPVEQVAGAIVALCSGLLDGMNGSVLTIDRGALFAGSAMQEFAGNDA